MLGSVGFVPRMVSFGTIAPGSTGIGILKERCPDEYDRILASKKVFSITKEDSDNDKPFSIRVNDAQKSFSILFTRIYKVAKQDLETPIDELTPGNLKPWLDKLKNKHDVGV